MELCRAELNTNIYEGKPMNRTSIIAVGWCLIILITGSVVMVKSNTEVYASFDLKLKKASLLTNHLEKKLSEDSVHTELVRDLRMKIEPAAEAGENSIIEPQIDSAILLVDSLHEVIEGEKDTLILELDNKVDTIRSSRSLSRLNPATTKTLREADTIVQELAFCFKAR